MAGVVLTDVVIDSSSKSFRLAMSGGLKKPVVWQSLRLLNSMSGSPMEFEPPVICWQLKVLKSSVVGPVDSQMEFEPLMLVVKCIHMFWVCWGAQNWRHKGSVHSQNEQYQVLWVGVEGNHCLALLELLSSHRQSQLG